MQVGSGGSAGNPEHLAYFRVRESFDVVQHDHRSRPFRQLRERLRKSSSQLRVDCGIPEGRLQCIAELLSRSDLAAPRYVERGVRHDSIHPCAEALRRVESIESLVRTDEPFLDSVLRVLVYGYDRPCNEVRATLMRADKTREGVLVARAGSFSKRAFLIRDTHRPCG